MDTQELIDRIKHYVLVNRLRVWTNDISVLVFSNILLIALYLEISLLFQVEEYFQDFDPLRHGSISRSIFRRCLSSMGQPNLTNEQFEVLALHYRDPKIPGNVMWTKFLTDTEVGMWLTVGKYSFFPNSDQLVVYFLTRKEIVIDCWKCIVCSIIWDSKRNSGALARQAPLVRKIGYPSSRENVIMTSLYKRYSSVQTLGEGEGRLSVICVFGCHQLIRFIYLLRSLSHQNQN